MTVLLTVAGIIAALILFRWARTLAMIAVLVTVAYFWVHFERWEATRPVATQVTQSRR